jgi:L-rhamnose-H+ transport protein
MERTMGYALVMVAGILQGAFILPMKSTRRWAWENTWFVYSTAGYLVFPWLFVLLTIPHPLSVLATTSFRSLLLVEVFGIGWGIGSLTFGLGVSRLGMALGFTIIIGLAATAGALIPMIVLSPEKLSQPQGLMTLASLVLVLIGLGLVAWGGKLRAPTQKAAEGSENSGLEVHGSFGAGLAICIASGLLSASANLGFTFGAEYQRRAIAQGAAPTMAGNALWAPLTLPLFLCSAGYCVWLMMKNQTGGLLILKGTRLYWALASLMGLMWIGGFAVYAPGVRLLGSLGTSVGWAVMMSTMVITANVLGFITGEWKGASRKALGLAVAGVGFLILAIGVVGYANHL